MDLSSPGVFTGMVSKTCAQKLNQTALDVNTVFGN